MAFCLSVVVMSELYELALSVDYGIISWLLNIF